jgi:hypothetical protein
MLMHFIIACMGVDSCERTHLSTRCCVDAEDCVAPTLRGLVGDGPTTLCREVKFHNSCM